MSPIVRRSPATKGRVPSSAGYHLYIESLMEKGSLSEDDRRRIDVDLKGGEAAPGRLVALTSQLLSRLSGQIGILGEQYVDGAPVLAEAFARVKLA